MNSLQLFTEKFKLLFFFKYKIFYIRQRKTSLSLLFECQSGEKSNQTKDDIHAIAHRVGRVLSFFSSRQNLDSPTPLAAGECAPHPVVRGGGAHSPAGEWLGESQFRRGDIHCGLWCSIYKST